MKIINKTFDEERALYGSDGLEVSSCRFDGSADGESAMKESKNLTVDNCFFNLRYPFWHNDNLKISDCEMTPLCRASLWYSKNISIKNCKMHGIKALRECDFAKIDSCDIISPEFGWNSGNVNMTNSTAESEYFMFGSHDLVFDNVKFKGKYSFQYVKNAVISNCDFNTKDAFWHCENVVIRNSRVKSEYIGWYCNGLTFIDCVIEGTQPFCYSKGLKLVNCEMLGADLAFEKSEVDATVKNKIISIKNPYSGSITLPGVDEIIIDDKQALCKIIIL